MVPCFGGCYLAQLGVMDDTLALQNSPIHLTYLGVHGTAVSPTAGTVVRATTVDSVRRERDDEMVDDARLRVC